MFPSYSYPKQAVAGLVLNALLGHHRSFAADARSCVKLVHPGLRLLGLDSIPSTAPFVITPNHYYRPGYSSQWTALAISASMQAEVHWIMTGELTFPGKWYAPLARPMARFALKRIARVYRFTTMPPMPPRPRDLAARVAAVRNVLRIAERTRDAVIGLAPEGGDRPGGRLSMPPSGLGRFCLRLAAVGFQFLPVGVYECDGALTLNFGSVYKLDCISVGGTRGNDRLAATMVMQHIAVLIPAELRGGFC